MDDGRQRPGNSVKGIRVPLRFLSGNVHEVFDRFDSEEAEGFVPAALPHIALKHSIKLNVGIENKELTPSSFVAHEA
jgi:hypothetical protein